MTCKISYQEDTVILDDADELMAVLELTPREVDENILLQIGEDITSLIMNDQDFLMLLEKVLDAQGGSKQPYLRCFGHHLSQVVTMPGTLPKALALLANESDQEYLLTTLGQKHLKKCISNVTDLADSLSWLYGKMDVFFIDLVGWEFVSHFVNSGQALGILAKVLSHGQETTFLDRLGWDKVADCIRNSDDLIAAFIGLEQANDRTLVDKLVDLNKLHFVIPSQQELEKVCRRGLFQEDADYLRSKCAQFLTYS
jgi:hypothetical protein